MLYLSLVDLTDIVDIFCNLSFCEYWNTVLIVNIRYFLPADFFFFWGGLLEIKSIKLRKKPQTLFDMDVGVFTYVFDPVPASLTRRWRRTVET